MTVAVRTVHDAAELRALARMAVTPDQARRLLAIALILEELSREEAARSTGMDRQTLRDWVHRFNTAGPEGLRDRKAPGRSRRLDAAQLAELKARVEAGPDPAKDGVVRWRRADLCGWAEARFQVSYQERGMGKIRRALGFARISARPAHPRADPERQAERKKTARADRGGGWREGPRQAARALVPDAMRAGSAETGGCPTSRTGAKHDRPDFRSWSRCLSCDRAQQHSVVDRRASARSR